MRRSSGYNVRIARGSRGRRARGLATDLMARRRDSAAAARYGTRSPRAAVVLAAIIGGGGRYVCGAAAGRCTRNGTRRYEALLRLDLRDGRQLHRAAEAVSRFAPAVDQRRA